MLDPASAPNPCPSPRAPGHSPQSAEPSAPLVPGIDPAPQDRETPADLPRFNHRGGPLSVGGGGGNEIFTFPYPLMVLGLYVGATF